MTNAVFFAGRDELSGLAPGDTFELGGVEGHHAATVKRFKPGETMDLVDGAGLRLACSVISVSAGSLELSIDGRTEESVPRPRIVLVQALAKDGRDELAIETATELGVDAVIPWQADRSIVRWRAERAEKSVAKWRKTVQAAAKQARRARVPEVLNFLDSAELVDFVAKQPESELVLLHEEAPPGGLRTGLEQWRAAAQLFLLVGPEGGMSERELTLFESVAPVRLRLGRHVLRSSTAGPAAIAVLNQALDRW